MGRRLLAAGQDAGDRIVLGLVTHSLYLAFTAV